MYVSITVKVGVGRVRSAATVGNCLATKECSDRPKRRSIAAAFEQLVAIKRKRAHVGRDQNPDVGGRKHAHVVLRRAATN